MTRKTMPTRRPNSQYRSREHLLEREVEALIKAANGNRHGLRDSTIIHMMWRHGLWVSEACGPANVDPHVAADSPAQLLQALQKRRDAGLPVRIVSGRADEHADAPHPLRLLRARGERPRHRRGA